MNEMAPEATSNGAIPFGAEFKDGATDSRLHLTPFLDALRDGRPWDAAFDDFWLNVTGAPRPDWPPLDGRINWLCLTDLTSTGVAIDLASPFGEVASGLAEEFDHVRYIGTSSTHGCIITERFRDTSSRVDVHLQDVPQLDSAAADCVVFVASAGWEHRVPKALRSPRKVAEWAHGLLRPGGWFAFMGPNPWSLGSLRFGVGALHAFARFSSLNRSIARGIHEARFEAVRRYVTSPRLDLPSIVVPHDRRALGAWSQVAGADLGRSGRVPALLQSIHFRGSLLLARR